MQHRQRRFSGAVSLAPQLWLWVLVAMGGFMVGANLVARIQGNNARAGFTTGLLTGSVLVGTIASLHRYQAAKDHRLEAGDLRQRLSALSHELAQTRRVKDGLETRNHTLQTQLTQRTQQAQAATEALEPMIRSGSSTVAALNASEQSLINKLRQAEARVQSLQTAITANRKADFKRGRTYEHEAAEQQIATIQADQAALEQQMTATITGLEAELAAARAEIQAWETEFETQLQRLG
jgi:DNA repair exonuclease SbcCD ATPase subunit